MMIGEKGEFHAFIDAMTELLSMRDPYTAVHQLRVAELSHALTLALGYDADQAESIRMAARVHDLGKVAIPTEILVRPAQLSTREFGLIRRHPVDGHGVLSQIPFPWPVAAVALQHHERLDGSGYPNGLVGDEISTEARIIAVADVAEAMLSHRPHRPAFTPDEVVDTLERDAGEKLDADVVDACVFLIRSPHFALA